MNSLVSLVLVGPMSVESDWVGYHVCLRLGSGPVKGDLTTTAIYQ